MAHWLLTLQYDGSRYHGWQVQPNGVTVQQVLQEAAAACGYRSVQLHKQGSTPAGPLPAQKPTPAPAAAEAPSALDQILANARKLGVEIREKD